MYCYANTLKRLGLSQSADLAEGEVSKDAAAAQRLFALCPKASQTPLCDLPDLARSLGLAKLLIKDERNRMGLGSFKALGAAYAIAKQAQEAVDKDPSKKLEEALRGRAFVCASAGNHGLSLAAGARLFGARAIVFIAATVPESFAERLRAKGAEVRREGEDYEAAMAAAMQQAQEQGWFLLSDSSWQGYSAPARDVMEGYLIMGAEAAEQWQEMLPGRAPTHLFVQAGVGGLAAAASVAARKAWGDKVKIIVVEPAAAPALLESVKQGGAVYAAGPVSNMGRLDCKEPSHLALKYLSEQADAFMTVSDEEVTQSIAVLSAQGLPTTPSGGAGFAALHHLLAKDPSACSDMKLNKDSRVMIYLSEGPE